MIRYLTCLLAGLFLAFTAWAEYPVVKCTNGTTAPPVADREVYLYGRLSPELRLDGEPNQPVQLALRGVGSGKESPTHLLHVGQGKNDVWGFSSTQSSLQWRSYDLNVSPAFKNSDIFYVGYSTLRTRYSVGRPVQAPEPENFLDGSWEPFVSGNTKWLSGLVVSGGKIDVLVSQKSIPNGPPTGADGTMIYCRAEGFVCGINVLQSDSNKAGFRVHLVGTPDNGQGTCEATNYYLLPGGNTAVFGRAVTDGIFFHRKP